MDHPNIFPCQWCKSTFNTKINLIIHEKLKHSDKSNKPINKKVNKCVACSDILCNSQQLRFHIRKHHFNLCPRVEISDGRHPQQVWFENVLNTDAVVRMERTGFNKIVLKKMAASSKPNANVRTLEFQPVDNVEDITSCGKGCNNYNETSLENQHTQASIDKAEKRRAAPSKSIETPAKIPKLMQGLVIDLESEEDSTISTCPTPQENNNTFSETYTEKHLPKNSTPTKHEGTNIAQVTGISAEINKLLAENLSSTLPRSEETETLYKIWKLLSEEHLVVDSVKSTTPKQIWSNESSLEDHIVENACKPSESYVIDITDEAETLVEVPKNLAENLPSTPSEPEVTETVATLPKFLADEHPIIDLESSPSSPTQKIDNSKVFYPSLKQICYNKVTENSLEELFVEKLPPTPPEPKENMIHAQNPKPAAGDLVDLKCSPPKPSLIPLSLTPPKPEEPLNDIVNYYHEKFLDMESELLTSDLKQICNNNVTGTSLAKQSTDTHTDINLESMHFTSDQNQISESCETAIPLEKQTSTMLKPKSNVCSVQISNIMTEKYPIIHLESIYRLSLPEQLYNSNINITETSAKTYQNKHTTEKSILIKLLNSGSGNKCDDNVNETYLQPNNNVPTSPKPDENMTLDQFKKDCTVKFHSAPPKPGETIPLSLDPEKEPSCLYENLKSDFTTLPLQQTCPSNVSETCNNQISNSILNETSLEKGIADKNSIFVLENICPTFAPMQVCNETSQEKHSNEKHSVTDFVRMYLNFSPEKTYNDDVTDTTLKQICLNSINESSLEKYKPSHEPEDNIPDKPPNYSTKELAFTPLNSEETVSNSSDLDKCPSGHKKQSAIDRNLKSELPKLLPKQTCHNNVTETATKQTSNNILTDASLGTSLAETNPIVDLQSLHLTLHPKQERNNKTPQEKNLNEKHPVIDFYNMSNTASEKIYDSNVTETSPKQTGINSVTESSKMHEPTSLESYDSTDKPKGFEAKCSLTLESDEISEELDKDLICLDENPPTAYMHLKNYFPDVFPRQTCYNNVTETSTTQVRNVNLTKSSLEINIAEKNPIMDFKNINLTSASEQIRSDESIQEKHAINRKDTELREDMFTLDDTPKLCGQEQPSTPLKLKERDIPNKIVKLHVNNKHLAIDVGVYPTPSSQKTCNNQASTKQMCKNINKTSSENNLAEKHPRSLFNPVNIGRPAKITKIVIKKPPQSLLRQLLRQPADTRLLLANTVSLLRKYLTAG